MALILSGLYFNTARTKIIVPITGGVAPYSLVGSSPYGVTVLDGSAGTVTPSAFAINGSTLEITVAAATPNTNYSVSMTAGKIQDSTPVTPLVNTALTTAVPFNPANVTAGTAFVDLLTRTNIVVPLSGGTAPYVLSTGVSGIAVTKSVGNTAQTVSAAVINGSNELVITLSVAIAPSDTNIKVTITNPTCTITDSYTNAPRTLATVTNASVTNETTIAWGTPVVNSALNKVTIPLTGGSGAYNVSDGGTLTGWSMYIDGSVQTVTATLRYTGNKVELTGWSGTITTNSRVVVGYTNPGTFHDTTPDHNQTVPNFPFTTVDVPGILYPDLACYGSTKNQIVLRVGGANGALVGASPSGFSLIGAIDGSSNPVTISSAVLGAGDSEIVFTLSGTVAASSLGTLTGSSVNVTDSGASAATFPDFSGFVVRSYQDIGPGKKRSGGMLIFGRGPRA